MLTFTAEASCRSRSSSCWCSDCSSLPRCNSFCFSSSFTGEEARPTEGQLSSWAANVLLGTSLSHLFISALVKKNLDPPRTPKVPYERRGPFSLPGTSYLSCG